MPDLEPVPGEPEAPHLVFDQLQSGVRERQVLPEGLDRKNASERGAAMMIHPHYQWVGTPVLTVSTLIFFLHAFSCNR